MTPEARAKAIAELEAIEANPPTVALTPEEVAQLEQEKRELSDGFVKPRSDAGRIRGEGSAIETGPVRTAGGTAQVAALPPINVLPGRAVRIQDTGVVSVREIGDFSAPKLARLLKNVKAAQKIATRQRMLHDNANEKYTNAMAELDDYMAEHGLGGWRGE